MVLPQSTSLSFVLTANYEFEKKSSQYQYNTLPQHVFQFVHNVRFFYVGDEYRSTGRNVSTNLQILAGILLVFITPKFVLLVNPNEKTNKQTNLFCNQNEGKKILFFSNSSIKVDRF